MASSKIGIADDLRAYLKKSALSASASRENLIQDEGGGGGGDGGDGGGGGGSIKTWFSSKFSNQNSSASSSSTSSGPPSSTFWFPGVDSSAEVEASFLSRKQRILGFVLCLVGGVVSFGMATLYLPVLLLKARKFALLYSLGSVFVISSFSFLWGPWVHLKHLFSRERLPFTATYLTTLILTIYFAIGLRSTMLTVVAAILQVLALLWYIISYLPGGQKGLSLFSRIFYRTASKTVTNTLNV